MNSNEIISKEIYISVSLLERIIYVKQCACTRSTRKEKQDALCIQEAAVLFSRSVVSIFSNDSFFDVRHENSSVRILSSETIYCMEKTTHALIGLVFGV